MLNAAEAQAGWAQRDWAKLTEWSHLKRTALKFLLGCQPTDCIVLSLIWLQRISRSEYRNKSESIRKLLTSPESSSTRNPQPCRKKKKKNSKATKDRVPETVDEKSYVIKFTPLWATLRPSKSICQCSNLRNSASWMCHCIWRQGI